MRFNKLFILIFSFLFLLAFPKTASADYSGTISAVQAGTNINVNFTVENQGFFIQSKDINVYIVTEGFLGYFQNGKQCPDTFDHDNSDGTSSFGQPMTVVCDMKGEMNGNYDVVVGDGNWFNGWGGWTQIATTSVTFTEGTVAGGQARFYRGPTRENDGTFKMTIRAGDFGLLSEREANLLINDPAYPPYWGGGTSYSCTPNPMKFNVSHSSEIDVVCDFSGLAPREQPYTLLLVRGKNPVGENIYDSALIQIKNIELDDPQPTGANRYSISGTRYSNSAPSSFSLKVESSGGGYLAAPVYPKTQSSIGGFTFGTIDFSVLSPGTWNIVLVDSSDNVLDTETISITSTAITNTCACEMVPPVGNACGANPQMRVTRNSCLTPTVPTPICLNPDPSQYQTTTSCSCTCVGTPAGAPSGGSIVLDYDENNLTSFFRLAQNIIIAIAVIAGVFIVPYAFVLMASGNPEKIQKGTDWLKSIFWGYLVIFLSGALIRFVGSEILSLGL